METTSNYFKQLTESKYFSALPDFREEKTRSYINLALTLFALSFLGMFAIQPSLATISHLKKELKDTKFVDQQLDEKLANLGALEQQYREIEQDVPIVLSAIPKHASVPTLIGQLQALARKHNLEVIRLQSLQVELSKATEGPQKYSSFVFALEVKGANDQINDFLSSLISFDRIITPETVTVSNDLKSDNRVVLNIRGRAFFKQ